MGGWRPSNFSTETPRSFANRPLEFTFGTPTILRPGEYTAGVDIAIGRYEVSAESGFGNIITYHEEYPEINEVIGVWDDRAGVPSVTLSLVQGQQISITRVSATFTPVLTELKTRLSAGLWEVGIDVRAGTYRVAADDVNMGYFVVFDGDTNKYIDRIVDSENGLDNFVITIKDREIIRVSGLAAVKLESLEK